jgi:hypothetical protein
MTVAKNLDQEFDDKWEKVKANYPPDPAMEVAVAYASCMDLIKELEKITKRN